MNTTNNARHLANDYPCGLVWDDDEEEDDEFNDDYYDSSTIWVDEE